MADLQAVLKQLTCDLAQLEQRWALVGGLAVSVRSEPRTTRDIDVVIAVERDHDAERLILDLGARGYGVESILEQEQTGRMATARLLAPGEEHGGVIVDLLFASSGAESEIVNRADLLEVLPEVNLPVASLGHLLALKVLAGRAKDLADVEALLIESADCDIDDAQKLLALIGERGYARGRNLEKLSAELFRRE